MRLGAENRKVLMAAIVLGAVALVLAARMVFMLAGTSASTPPASPSQQGPQARKVRGPAPAKLPATNSLDPTLRLDVLTSAAKTEYKGSGRNIFDFKQRELPRPVVTPDQRKQPPPPQCPGDPRCPPPPIPLTFYGFASKPGEAKKIFLSSKETGDVFIAGEGEIVNRRYRVLHIGVNSVEIEDVLSNNRQTIPLTQG